MNITTLERVAILEANGTKIAVVFNQTDEETCKKISDLWVNTLTCFVLPPNKPSNKFKLISFSQKFDFTIASWVASYLAPEDRTSVLIEGYRVHTPPPQITVHHDGELEL